ncbi:S66 peptidase family protein [Pseudarthrobacter sp. J1738]|uniref:S66 peptidase family protein n=1 Tax=Pseudarthrobacter sp. J1738 TaxID=3420446 RepID=UPI003D26836F
MMEHPKTTDILAPLQLGDRVGLVATSGPPVPAMIERSVALLESWGLVPVLGDHLRAAHPRALYLAGTDEQRAADLQNAWCDPSLAAVFVIRGGYGSVRLLDLLDVDQLRAAEPKPLFGSSDITGIHEFWGEKLGLPSWFTPMLATAALLDDAVATTRLKAAVFAPFPGRSYTAATAQTLVSGTAHGILTGGNLSLLVMTLGGRGRVLPNNTGRIALLEDVTEPTYKIDGMLTSLLRAGWFEGLSGIALGSWQDCGDLEEIKKLCVELLGPLGVPLVWELGFGHGPAAHSIPLGVPATLHAPDGSQPRLVLE